MYFTRTTLFALVFGTALALPGLASAQYTFKTIDLGNGLNTSVNGSSEHALAGQFDDAAAVTHGFVMTRHTTTQFDVPFAGAFFTSCNFVNDRGQISGIYMDADGEHGWFLDKGHYTAIDGPGAIATEALGVNNRGQVVGGYVESLSPLKVHALVWQNGSMSFFNYPGMPHTFGIGINDRGDIVGTYRDPSLARHGFLRTAKGQFVTIDHPLSAFGTWPETINNEGTLVGFYLDSTGTPHGYIWRNGSFKPFEVPGAVATFAFTINDEGEIGGQYIDAAGTTHGFVATPIHHG